jgi:hypothetical protein
LIAREHAKFVFSRSVSRALAILDAIGAEHGFSREDLSYADIRDILDLRICSWEPKESLARSIEIGKRRYERTSSITLPPLIRSHEDVWAFQVPSARRTLSPKRCLKPRPHALARDLSGSNHSDPPCPPGIRLAVRKAHGTVSTGA